MSIVLGYWEERSQLRAENVGSAGFDESSWRHRVILRLHLGGVAWNRASRFGAKREVTCRSHGACLLEARRNSRIAELRRDGRMISRHQSYC
jgi:hypothetical protein